MLKIIGKYLRENGTENGTLLEKVDFSDPMPRRLPSYTEAPGE
jgi:hypothetical protein